MRIGRTMLIKGLFVGFVLVLIFVFQIQVFEQGLNKSDTLAVVEPVFNLPAPEIEARAAYAEDFLNGDVLFEKNGSYPLPLASLTKIISSLVFLDYVEFDDEVQTQRGERFKVRDLLAMIMVESSNGAVETLFRHIIGLYGVNPKSAKEWFFNLMSEKAASLGGGGMLFDTIDGTDTSENAAGAMGSARGIMQITKATLDSQLWQYGAIHEVVSRDGLIYSLKATNELESEIHGLIGAKTGFTDLAGGNLLIMFEYPIGHPVGIVVLGSSQSGRFSDVKKIYEWIKLR